MRNDEMRVMTGKCNGIGMNKGEGWMIDGSRRVGEGGRMNRMHWGTQYPKGNDAGCKMDMGE
jgi:hypothetical protein